jgi:hypothetical protein
MPKTNTKGLLQNPQTISLRLDGRTFNAVKKAAEKNYRSVAAEINYRLRGSLQAEGEAAA